jgi:hypothetical protein
LFRYVRLLKGRPEPALRSIREMEGQRPEPFFTRPEIDKS